MKKHIIWMLIGCSIPLLLIFLAPGLGLSGNWGLLIFVIAMFACHLLMPHGAHDHHQKNDSETTKTENHEHH